MSYSIEQISLFTSAMKVKESTSNKIVTPGDVADLLKETAVLSQEAFSVITLNTKNSVIDRHLVTLGLMDQCLVHPREVFRPAIADGAASVILSHNHPSGDPTPSGEDIRMTKQLIEAGNILDVKVIDHVIIGRGETPFISLRESGLLSF